MTRGWKKLAAAVAVFVFVFASLSFQAPNKAHALFGIDGCFVFCPIQLVEDTISAGANVVSAGADVVTGASTTSTAVTTGITTAVETTELVVTGTQAERAVTDTILTPTFCDAFANANLFLDTLDTVGNSLAGSDKAQIGNTFFISYKVESTRRQLQSCWVPLETAAQTAKGVTISQAENLEANRTLIATKKQTLTNQLVEYEKIRKQSFQDVFEAIAYNFAMEAFKQVTIKGVNEMVDKLKINGYLKYADALATQVYSIDYIKKNFSKDKQRELIAASLFKNAALGDITGLNNAVGIAKQKASEYNVTEEMVADWSSPRYWGTVAGAADERIWPEYHMLVGRSDAQLAMANGKKSAESEIQNSQGFKGMRDCKDVTSQQAQIDANIAAANRKVEEAEAVIGLLTADSTDEDRELARLEYRRAVEEAKQVQGRSNGGLAEACGVITNPAGSLADMATEWVSGLIGQNFDIKGSGSLFGSLAGKLGSTLLNDLLNGRKGSVLDDLKNGLVPLGISAGLQAVINSNNNSGPGGDNTNNSSGGGSMLPVIGDGATMVFTYTYPSANQLALKIKFEVSDNIVPKSLRIVSTDSRGTNDDIFEIKTSDYVQANGLITGTIILDSDRPTRETKYTVTFRGLKRDVGVTLFNLVTATVTVPAPGTVSGAYTSVFMPRGPESALPHNSANYRYY